MPFLEIRFYLTTLGRGVLVSGALGEGKVKGLARLGLVKMSWGVWVFWAMAQCNS